VRRNIITKGAVVDTDIGHVKITSRPGQSGALNGIKVA
jgi:small subunit ribosomal protein S8e